MNPLNGVGYEHYHGADPPSTEPNDTWGSCKWIHDLFKVAGAAYENQYPGEELGYGDISLPGGGFYSPHVCHQNGLEVDIFYESIDGQFVQIDFDQTTVSAQ
jgi:murein endopeptidase